MNTEYRIETDFLGEVKIPSGAYYGIQTQRAIENFPITHRTLGHEMPELINAYALIKKSSALANFELKLLGQTEKDAIIFACDELLQGKYLDQFPIDPIQGGAGTSTNMNVNEVIANIALEHLGYDKGRYDIISPNDHVNRSQSTNDTYPSSIKIALFFLVNELYTSLDHLTKSFEGKAVEFKDIYKIGRTQLQDAVPMKLGQTFKTFSQMIGTGLGDLKHISKNLNELNMGATAIGTGIWTHKGYKGIIQKHIKEIVGEEFYISRMFLGTQDATTFLSFSSMIRKIAVQLSKISNDLRLLSSGPRAGINEINLPQRQAGSSIMPGKVNPVIPEVVNQVCFQIIGFDMAVALACEGGQLELNAFEPLIAYNIITQIKQLTRAINTLNEKCVIGITANIEVCNYQVEHSLSLATALNQHIGYKKATEIVVRASKENKTIRGILIEDKLFTPEEIDKILDPSNTIEDFADD